jgi:Flp pilus assembly protein TadD
VNGSLKSLPGVPHLNGDIGSRLASSYYNQGDFEAAAETYVLTAEIPFARPIMTYNAACSYALIGRKEEAITWLGKCRETGQMNLSAAWNDTDFVSLRDDPRFAEIVGPRP